MAGEEDSVECSKVKEHNAWNFYMLGLNNLRRERTGVRWRVMMSEELVRWLDWTLRRLFLLFSACGLALFDIMAFRQTLYILLFFRPCTVIANLSYASPAWWRLTSAADRDRLEAFLRWLTALGFRPATAPMTLGTICSEADDTCSRRLHSTRSTFLITSYTTLAWHALLSEFELLHSVIIISLSECYRHLHRLLIQSQNSLVLFCKHFWPLTTQFMHFWFTFTCWF